MDDVPTTDPDYTGIVYVERGWKKYELSNHLGNVLTVITDRRSCYGTDDEDLYYEADIVTITDYYPFGSPMGVRTEYQEGYRFGFNGQERDDDVALTGNINTALFWEYDTRLGRRWNLDPEPQISISNYAVLNLSPIKCVDILGDKAEYKNSKSRLIVLFARLFNKEYRDKFRDMKNDPDNTFVFHYSGGKWDKKTLDTYHNDPTSQGFVTKDGEKKYTIHFLNTKGDVSGSTKYSSLYEESFHVDDALGGKVFGGKNASTITFNEFGVLSFIKQPTEFAKGEVDAWIWRADHDRIITTYLKQKVEGVTIKFRVKNNLMQQIHNTKGFDYDKRVKIVAGFLYTGYMLEFEPAIDSKGNTLQPRSVLRDPIYR